MEGEFLFQSPWFLTLFFDATVRFINQMHNSMETHENSLAMMQQNLNQLSKKIENMDKLSKEGFQLMESST